MTHPDWASLRNHAIKLFNETPHPTTEQDIIDAYQLHPDAVARAIDSIAANVTNGTIRTGWGVLRKRANTIAAPPANPTRATGLNHEKAIAHAEQWIRAAGIHYDTPTEILEELFGDLGQLRNHAQVKHQWAKGDTESVRVTTGDKALTTQMLNHWAEHRPTGIRIEQDAQARAETWKQQQAELAEHFAALHPPPPPAEHEPVAVPANPDNTPNDSIPF